MRRITLMAKGLPLLALVLLAAASAAEAQSQGAASSQPTAPAKMSRDDIIAFARIQLAIDSVRDSLQFVFPVVGNKKDEQQQLLQETLRKRVEEVMHHKGITDAEYKKKVFIVATENDVRKLYDSVMGGPDGSCSSGTQVATAGGRVADAVVGAPAPITLPPGAVGTHVGHVMNGFSDTPNGVGTTSRRRRRMLAVAAQHATLAARAPTDLAGMKLHAGHVIHALDPTVVAMGPGSGYGLKKGATGAASHIELAANAEGASASVKTHANHVAVASRSAVKRADQIIELAQKIQAATAAPEAAGAAE